MRPAGPQSPSEWRYVGRFAPSPTGSLHLGSLLAAVGSFLDARHHGGLWLVRIEDLDTPRVVPGSADEILRTLERFGLGWDGAVEYQSRRIDLYRQVLAELRERGRVFECSCSRRMLAEADETGYPGYCRGGPTRPGPTATRFRIDESKTVSFIDRVQGPCAVPLESMGDVVIRRRDGLFAYQLAVVVDDADQGITDVVRGADLLPSTAWQIELQEALELAQPRYAHLPLVLERDGSKLSKTKHSVPVEPEKAAALLVTVLRLLRQDPPSALAREAPAHVLDWGLAHWNLKKLSETREASLTL